jgi:hypothetical protein
MTSVILHLNILFSCNVMIEFTIWLILKFWPNKFRNSSVTHCPKFILFRPFSRIWPKSHRILFTIFRIFTYAIIQANFKFLAYDTAIWLRIIDQEVWFILIKLFLTIWLNTSENHLYIYATKCIDYIGSTIFSSWPYLSMNYT